MKGGKRRGNKREERGMRGAWMREIMRGRKRGEETSMRGDWVQVKKTKGEERKEQMSGKDLQ